MVGTRPVVVYFKSQFHHWFLFSANFINDLAKRWNLYSQFTSFYRIVKPHECWGVNGGEGWGPHEWDLWYPSEHKDNVKDMLSTLLHLPFSPFRVLLLCICGQIHTQRTSSECPLHFIISVLFSKKNYYLLPKKRVQYL